MGMNRALLDAERASIHADPDGELEELVGLYVVTGLDADLARQIAHALTKPTRSPRTLTPN